MAPIARSVRANCVTLHLKARPMFTLKEGHLWIAYQGYDSTKGVPLIREHRVIIDRDTDFMLRHRRHPWGGNQGQALSILAKWIRTGKMPLTFDQWRRWCGPPVMLGNPEFLEAIRQHIYGGTTTREEIMEALA